MIKTLVLLLGMSIGLLDNNFSNQEVSKPDVRTSITAFCDFDIVSFGCTGPPQNLASYRIQTKPGMKVSIVPLPNGQAYAPTSVMANGTIYIFENVPTAISYSITISDPVTNYSCTDTFTGLCN